MVQFGAAWFGSRRLSKRKYQLQHNLNHSGRLSSGAAPLRSHCFWWCTWQRRVFTRSETWVGSRTETRDNESDTGRKHLHRSREYRKKTTWRSEDQTMTMTTTHSDKSDIRQMKAWPYRQECRGHDPAKKESVVLMKLVLLARCAQTHCYGQCAVHQVLRWTQNKENKNTRQQTGCCWYVFTNSDLRILGFGATRRIRQGRQEGDTQAREAKKKQHPERKSAEYRSSSVAPDSIQIFFSTKNSYSIASSL